MTGKFSRVRRAVSIVVCGGAALAVGLGLSAALPAETSSDAFTNLAREPNRVTADTAQGAVDLVPTAGGEWQGGGLTVHADLMPQGLAVTLAAPRAAVKCLHVHWAGKLYPKWKYLGDAWERAYGDLEWKPLDGQRPMPWYFLASDVLQTDGYGVMTGPGALCCWKADADGIDLTADVRAGGVGVRLGGRKLAVCTVTCRRGKAGETPFAAARAFCADVSPAATAQAAGVRLQRLVLHLWQEHGGWVLAHRDRRCGAGAVGQR